MKIFHKSCLFHFLVLNIETGLRTQKEGQGHQSGHAEGQGQIQGTGAGVKSDTAPAAASQVNQLQGQDPEVQNEDLSPQGKLSNHHISACNTYKTMKLNIDLRHYNDYLFQLIWRGLILLHSI